MATDDAVKGMGEAMRQAEEGMKLFKTEEAAELDVEGATAFKDEMDKKMVELEAEAAALTGKENKKLRQAKDKERSSIKTQKDYIDACKVIKGLQPPGGHFVKRVAPKEAPKEEKPAEVEAPKEEETKKKETKEKPKKAQESAGISKAERDELESLKNKIIDKKKALKEQGMSGGQMNKDEEIVSWVSRMNDLKEKECPGSLQAAKDDKKGKKKKQLDSATAALIEQKQKDLDEYTEKLRTEFKYSKKEIAADPDLQEMKAELAKLTK